MLILPRFAVQASIRIPRDVVRIVNVFNKIVSSPRYPLKHKLSFPHTPFFQTCAIWALAQTVVLAQWFIPKERNSLALMANHSGRCPLKQAPRTRNTHNLRQQAPTAHSPMIAPSKDKTANKAQKALENVLNKTHTLLFFPRPSRANHPTPEQKAVRAAAK
jgi:hypothetical protein